MKKHDFSGSPDRFGYEWGHYKTMLGYYEVQFRRWLPFMDKDDWKGKIFLDVGCGMGRNSYWPLTYGASEGFSIDVDLNSLESAKSTLSGFPNSHVEFISAYEIPYKDKFDIAFSIGVIHHLESPLEAIRGMVRSVKPGGKVAIWVYGYENNQWLIFLLNPLRKLFFSKLPIGIVHHLSLYPTCVLFVALRIYKFKLEYLRLISKFDFDHLRSIVFDQMLPRIANYWSKSEALQLMQNAKLQDIEISHVNEMSWAVIGTKDPSS